MYQKLWSDDVQFLPRYRAWRIQLLFLISSYFCPFTSLTALKIKILEKRNKHQEIPSFSICIPKIMIRWCMVPEIWCVKDLVISQFGLFLSFYPPNNPKNQNLEKMKNKAWRYHHFTYVYQKLWSDDVWFLRYGAWWM